MKRSTIITSTTLDTEPISNKRTKIELDYGESGSRSENNYEDIWSQLKVMASNLASDCQAELNDIMFIKTRTH